MIHSFARHEKRSSMGDSFASHVIRPLAGFASNSFIQFEDQKKRQFDKKFKNKPDKATYRDK